MFYQGPYQSKSYSLEAFKAHLKISKAHNEAVGYHPTLAAIMIQEKHNITSDTTNEEHNNAANIKAR